MFQQQQPAARQKHYSQNKRKKKEKPLQQQKEKDTAIAQQYAFFLFFLVQGVLHTFKVEIPLVEYCRQPIICIGRRGQGGDGDQAGKSRSCACQGSAEVGGGTLEGAGGAIQTRRSTSLHRRLRAYNQARNLLCKLVECVVCIAPPALLMLKRQLLLTLDTRDFCFCLISAWS